MEKNYYLNLKSQYLIAPLVFLSGLNALFLAENTQAAETLAPMTVSASRANVGVTESSQRVLIISKEEVQRQADLGADVSSALSTLIPGYSPSRQKMSSYGETFRGRKVLYMIDGIPQSNPLRDGSRASHTIDLSMVERIEVIAGASAEHGLGATGGIINFITKSSSNMPGEVKQSAKMSLFTDQGLHSKGSGGKLDYQVSTGTENLDALLSLSVTEHGMFYDSDDQFIGVSDSQGDLMNTRSHDIFGKLLYAIDDDKELSFSLNRFALESHHDYVNVAGDRDNGVVATSIKQPPPGKPLENDVWTVNGGYHDSDFVGTELDIQVYYQQFSARFGGGINSTFQDATIAPLGTLDDQAENRSEKLGFKLTMNKRALFNNKLDLTWGLDYLQDTTVQTLIMTGRDWVPETQFFNYAPFLQTTYRLTDDLALNAGIRYEKAELDVDSFTTLAKYGNRDVDGGNPDFEETLYNMGLTYAINPALQTYISYSEGFGMADVGRLLRQIDQPGQDVDTFLNLEPIVTVNREIGLRFDHYPFNGEISYFNSTSDLGYRLEQVNDQFLAQRQKTEIQGVEITAGWAITEDQNIKVSYAHTEGKFDSNGNNRVDTQLGGVNISPDKLSLFYDNQFTHNTRLGVQGSYLFDRSFEPASNGDDLSFDGYALVDLVISHDLGRGTVNFGVSNLLNEDYITYYGQTGSTRDSNYIKGRGRNLTVSYGLDF